MFKNLPKRVKVVEVGPRDGLQNESKALSTKEKAALIDSLSLSGLEFIEATSFVSPKWIPQLADGRQVLEALNIPSRVQLSALVPNIQGYEAAKSSGLKNIAVFMSATESHSKKNINKSIAEALSTIQSVVEIAKQDAMFVRAYLSVIFYCPYEGLVPPQTVVHLVNSVLEMGVDEVSLGDTIGRANPKQVYELVESLEKKISLSKLALHFHDTFGMALSNVVAGLESGITIYDASIGGMGGCPYAKGASGNLATEDLVFLLDSLNIETGINLNQLVESGKLAQRLLNKQLPGKYLKAALSESDNTISAA